MDNATGNEDNNMKNYKVILRSAPWIFWFEQGISPTEAVSKVVASLNQQGYPYVGRDFKAELS